MPAVIPFSDRISTNSPQVHKESERMSTIVSHGYSSSSMPLYSCIAVLSSQEEIEKSAQHMYTVFCTHANSKMKRETLGLVAMSGFVYER